MEGKRRGKGITSKCRKDKKVMRYRDKSGKVIESGKWPRGVCRKGVGNNSIQFQKCVRKKCSKMKGSLKQNKGCVCEACHTNTAQSDEEMDKLEVQLGQEFKWNVLIASATCI